ncbi:UNVERIFIED_CONTAM: hypothetical protein PYX00_011709 [Menopon gallinae]|uniref:Endoplasmic reticulum oxidoreductin n=1 Tax=Menopon gallinae TaxID=328185 RepID=A0AAW2H8G8_9NEOP
MKTQINIRIAVLLLLVLAAACQRVSNLDAGMQIINDLTYRKLAELVSKDAFSIIDMNLNERCPLDAAACHNKRCRVERTHRSGRPAGSFRVDLRSVPEGYSPDAKNSSFIWKRIYELAHRDAFLQALISGLHFSITIHIASFFTSFHGVFIPNSIHYFQKYRRDYKTNMYILYLYVRSSVYALGKNHRPSLAVHASLDPRADMKHILRLRKMLYVVNCLSCDRCRVWGRVQLHGLIAATKIHMSMDAKYLSTNELVCLVHLFHKLSTSVREMKRLESFRWRPKVWVSSPCL